MSSLLVKVVFLCAFFPDVCVFILFALRSSFSFSLRVATLPVARKATDRVNYPTKFSFSHYDYHKHHHHLYYFFCFSFSYQNSTFIFLFVLFCFDLVWFVFPPIDEMGSLEWVRERRMPFPQLGYGSDKPFALEKAFVIGNVISCDYCVPLSIKTMKGSFLVLNCENLVGFLEYKPMNV